MADATLEQSGVAQPVDPSATDGLERSDTTAAVRRLAAATKRLAMTIRATEELAESRAELLRTATTGVVLDGRFASSRPGIVSLNEAAKRTGRHPEVLRRWCQDGRIPAIRVGRTWAITSETLTALMEHNARSRPRLNRSSS
jgi:excisionase family DNA binding protein